jgi:hypothetical protein
MGDSQRAKVGHLRQVRWLAVALAVSAIGVTACGDDDEDEDGTTASSEERGTTVGDGGEAILIKTHLTIPTGEVLPGSSIGDSSFCADGSFRDRGADARVVKTFRCSDGRLTISFSPGSPHKAVQRGPWEIVSGSGRFEGLRGGGQGKAEFEGPDEGRETFTGTVAR